jgi:molecular chaperone GrpE
MTDRPAADDTAAPLHGETAAAPELVPAEQVTAALEAAADFKDNLRKRTEREVADGRLYAITGFAREVLAVADNMHRALGAVGPELREHADPQVKSFIEGIELTERELMKALEKSGVRKFSPEAEKFDPNVHQAMYEMETQDVPPGHVAQVIQAGYMIGDRVLRPAMVAVAKGAKSGKPANDDSVD